MTLIKKGSITKIKDYNKVFYFVVIKSRNKKHIGKKLAVPSRQLKEVNVTIVFAS